jgi:hypothetical protein
MKDDTNYGMYEAQEYHPGGYPQIRRKRTVHAITHKNTAKQTVNILWGMTLFGLFGISAVCAVVLWIV